ncbi:hypothetical protein MMC07_008895 [Pseudocyphellaria aurata]|nr:hypothetical protein [Pseudocyphellaria aurata]
MTSTSEPVKNPHTPPHPELASQPNLRMPFSSPMGEEILSPTSPNLPRSPIRSRRKNTLDEAGLENAQSWNRKFAVQKSPKRGSSRKQEKSQNKTRWPELNVVTNFSKPPVLAQRAAEADVRHRARRKESRVQDHRPGYVTLSDIKAPVDRKAYGDYKTHKRNQSSGGRDLKIRDESNPKKEEDLAAGLGLQPFENPPDFPFVEGKGRVNGLKHSPTKITELSPSDRPIMIGISIPSAKLAEHSISPDVGLAGSSPRQYATDRDPPMTPTIIVTPAKVERSSSDESYEQNAVSQDRRRAVSSVYSQTFQHGRGWAQTTDIPPVPSHPFVPSKYTPPTNPFENDDKGSPSRVVSSCTIFDEDELRGRPDSGESQLRILKRSSTDTIATRHRSQGWWNHIVSPFITRGNTMMFKASSPEVGTPVPALPTPIHRGTTLREQYRKNSDETSPSSASRVEDVGKDDRSVSINARRFEATRHNIGLAFDHTPGTSTLVLDPQDVTDPGVSNTPLPFEGFGAAAEYFHAYWHDQNSPTPYFKCQNHVCPPRTNRPVTLEARTLEARNEETPEGSPQDPSSARDLPETHRHDGMQINIFQQAPENRFSAAFSQASKSKPRPRALSEVTDIEDLDITPVVQEAHAAPIIRAGAPILASQSSLSEIAPAAPAPAVHAAAPAAAAPAFVPASASAPAPVPAPVHVPTTAPVDPTPAFGPTNTATSAGQGQTPSQETTRAVAPEPFPVSSEKPPSSTATPAARGQTPRQETTESREGTVAPLPFPVSSRQPPTYFPPKTQKLPKRSATVKQPDESVARGQPSGPEPPDPSVLRSGAIPRKAVPVGESARGDVSQPAQNTYIVNHYYDDSNRRVRREEITLANFEPPPRISHSVEVSRDKREKREKDGYHRQDDRKQRKCLKFRTCFTKKPMTKKKKGLLIGIAISLVILIILILALAMTLTRKGGDKMPAQTQWLNITGFPPVPTGISTIVQPEAVENRACVQPATLWSCALPKEEQPSIAPNDPDQPNFRVEIRFLNGTSTNGSRSSKRSQTPVNAVSAGSFIRHRFLRIRDSLTSSLFTPNPSPPSQEDQVFLGNTTEKNSLPFDGETTPFFMSFLPASKLPQRLVKRASGNNNDSFPDVTKLIPPPDLNPDGTAAAPNLLPFPSAQPLRLYNRGLATEHYGFYTYYDRSIFLKSTALLNDTGTSTGDVPDDEKGGTTEAAASVRCTWAQTRFLVQIWTNQANAVTLLGNSSHFATSQNATESSANDFTRPGSFPYPVTISLDRHGGDVTKKLIYCYGIDAREHVLQSRKKVQLENRSVGGVLVNPAQGLFATTKVGKNEGGPGGVDGGSGGCGCRWRNFDGGA